MEAGKQEGEDAAVAIADLDGVFPEGFYATTNHATDVRVRGAWVRVEAIEMDVGIRITGDGAEACPMHRVRKGDEVVVGEAGVRVAVPAAAGSEPEAFRFMSSAASTERPKARLVAGVADAMRAAHATGGKILFVGGPAIVHSGSAPVLEKLVRDGWIDVLFAGNALAAHDIEAAMYGTSLGIDLARGESIPHGHQHHLRAINRVRRAGSIAEAVHQGLVTRGVMHACITKPIPFVLAGSIRDDGPLPDVFTDAVHAADAMRELVPGVTVAIIVATTLHGVATGNMLPATVATFCVDSSADTVIKLVD
ncbi:MAG: bifunctional enzyme conserved domain protein, partial [Myxococcaceae bacterium]|nr:bifunctional enzyme conserved domain protein [Myxococcaceae bacterium]